MSVLRTSLWNRDTGMLDMRSYTGAAPSWDQRGHILYQVNHIYIYNILMQPSMWCLVQTLITLLLMSSSFLQMSVKLLQYLMKWVCVCVKRERCVCGGGGGVVHTHPRTHNTSSFFLVVIGGAICNYEREKKATAHFLSSNQGNCYEIDVPMRHTHTYYNFFFP